MDILNLVSEVTNDTGEGEKRKKNMGVYSTGEQRAFLRGRDR